MTLWLAVQAVIEENIALQQRNDDLEARLATLEQALGLTEATPAPLSSLFSGTSMIWMIGAGLGLVLGGPGLVLGYRRFRGCDNELG